MTNTVPPTKPPHAAQSLPGRLTRTDDGALARFDYTGLRALVVEPDDEARDAIEGALRSIGIARTFGARSASHAIEIAADLDLDLMLCDVTLDYPEGDDGLSLVLDVREDRTPLDEDIPILFFAGDAGSFSVMEAKRLGVHDFLAKPVPLKRLESSLQRLMLDQFPTRVQPST